MAIEQFKDDQAYLSNMFPQRVGNLVLPEGIEVPSVEHGYQADRFMDPEDRRHILTMSTGHVAKQLSRVLQKEGAPLRPDWKDRRLPVVRGLVLQKFTRNTELAERLLATGDQPLIEGNDWGDRFWGVCPPFSDKGENWLGKILVDTREQLRSNPEGLEV